MSITQYLRIIWTRKWLVLALLLVTIAVGTAVTLLMPKQYTADASLVVDVRVDPVMGMLAPARQSATWLDEQSKVLRANLEQAQSRLSKFQQEKGIVVSDERLDQETARYNALITQLALAQTEQVDTSTRRRNSGSDQSPEVLQSASVQSLKSQVATAEAKLSEISSVVGKNHPQRIQLEAQLQELKQQLGAEMRRVSGGSSVVNRSSAQKVEELKALVDQQKHQLLSLRSQRDQIAVLVRDVESAQRAYEGISGRMTQLTLEGQNTQANVRLLSPAIEPYYPSRPRVLVNILGSIFGG